MTRSSSDARYELTFASDELPPVDAFWSLTMYKADMNLVPNPADRYSLGDRTPGIQKSDDGAITFSIQHSSPGADKESNWLPCPNSGTWFVILRLYQPHQTVIDATWRCPGIRKMSDDHGEQSGSIAS